MENEIKLVAPTLCAGVVREVGQTRCAHRWGLAWIKPIMASSCPIIAKRMERHHVNLLVRRPVCREREREILLVNSGIWSQTKRGLVELTLVDLCLWNQPNKHRCRLAVGRAARGGSKSQCLVSPPLRSAPALGLLH